MSTCVLEITGQSTIYSRWPPKSIKLASDGRFRLPFHLKNGRGIGHSSCLGGQTKFWHAYRRESRRRPSILGRKFCPSWKERSTGPGRERYGYRVVQPKRNASAYLHIMRPPTMYNVIHRRTCLWISVHVPTEVHGAHLLPPIFSGCLTRCASCWRTEGPSCYRGPGIGFGARPVPKARAPRRPPAA